jgi:hypothetical protein
MAPPVSMGGPACTSPYGGNRSTATRPCSRLPAHGSASTSPPSTTTTRTSRSPCPCSGDQQLAAPRLHPMCQGDDLRRPWHLRVRAHRQHGSGGSATCLHARLRRRLHLGRGRGRRPDQAGGQHQRGSLESAPERQPHARRGGPAHVARVRSSGSIGMDHLIIRRLAKNRRFAGQAPSLWSVEPGLEFLL